MSEQRPNPDHLLARVQAAEAEQTRGHLKIFFGATAGVGKTYAMLEEAQQRRAHGLDVVIGWVQPHGRRETEALAEGLEQLPLRDVDYRGATLREFDLDAALARRPQVILVDELAHTNAPGMRHPKRWQDVEELLDAGIGVYTTVNVQHLESLNGVVAQITGVVVRETVPDRILERADEVELIDLPPDDLLQRLREGKVYVSQQAQQATKSFFRKGNLIALRELALRRTADRVDAQMQLYRQDHAIANTWPATERILVCISPTLLAPRLVRATRRMAASLRAQWLVVYVETPAHARLSDAARDQVTHTLRLAEQLGAETVTLSGHSVAEAVLQYAHMRNVSKIVVGKPIKPRWRELVFGSVVDEIVRQSGEIDVYVISGEHDDTRTTPAPVFQRTSQRRAYGWGMVVVASCTAVCYGMFVLNFAAANLIMVYLLGVILVATRYGRGPSLLASVVSVAAFDFFFVQPHLTFAVSDTQYLVTFAVMLVVALVISTLTVRVRQQADVAQQRERRTSALYTLSRTFASTRGVRNLVQAAVPFISDVADSQVTVFLPDADNKLASCCTGEQAFVPDQAEFGVAQWVYDHGRLAGLGTDTLPGAGALYLPLNGTRGTVGVLGVRPPARRVFPPEHVHLLETFANQTALAIERAYLADEAEQGRIEIETERLRSSLLSSVSHDLRTPLATITGATSSLLHADGQLDDATRRDLIVSIGDEADRLNRLVRNLLDMTRLEAGAVDVQREWQPLEEVVGAALTRLDNQLADRVITTQLPPSLPLVPIDGVLIEQVLVNVLENALKYTPPTSSITVGAFADGSGVTVEVADRGPGVPSGDEARVFDKFYRAQDGGRGVGLGLAICRAIVEAHGGRIWVENRPDGGAVFRFTLPLVGAPPPVPAEANLAAMTVAR